MIGRSCHWGKFGGGIGDSLTMLSWTAIFVFVYINNLVLLLVLHLSYFVQCNLCNRVTSGRNIRNSPKESRLMHIRNLLFECRDSSSMQPPFWFTETKR